MGELLTEGIGKGVDVGEGVGVGGGVGVGVGVGLGAGVGIGLGVGVAFLTTTPLFQSNFFPDLMQVYFLPLYVLTMPCFEQTDPAFGGAAE